MPSGVYKRTKYHRDILSQYHANVNGKNNPNFGKHFSKSIRRKMRESHIGKPHSIKMRKNMSKSMKRFYREHPNAKESIRLSKLGTHHSDATRQKMREHRLGKVYPNFNSEACKQIDEYGRQHGYHFQHALNGGEIKVIGYSLDGYDKNKNVVIEYYESAHQRTKKRDAKRKKEIINHLHCKFIELKEWD